MWRKWLKVASVAVVVLALLGGGRGGCRRVAGRTQAAALGRWRVVPVGYARGPAVLKLGKYLFESRGCAECHGDDGRGIAFIDSPDGIYVKSPNITTGPGAWSPTTTRATGCAPFATA